MRRLLGTGLLFALLAVSANAQGVFGEQPGDVICVGGVGGALYHVDGYGSTQSLTPSGFVGRVRPHSAGSYAFVDSNYSYFDVVGIAGGPGPRPPRPPLPPPSVNGSVVDVRGRSLADGYGDTTFFVLDDTPGIFMTEENSPPTTLHIGPPLQMPTAFVADTLGNMWIGDAGVGGILFRSTTGTMSTLATGLWCDNAADLTLDRHGNLLVVNSGAIDGVFRVNPMGGVTTVLIGNPMVTPSGIAVRKNGAYLVSDSGAGAIFEVSPGGAVFTLATGIPLVSSPVEVEPIGNTWITDSASPGGLMSVSMFGPSTSIVSGGPWSGSAPDAIVHDRRHQFVMAANDTIFSVTSAGMLATLHLGFPLTNLNDIKVDATGNYLLAGASGQNGMLWRMDASGAITTIYNGSASHAGAVESCDSVAFGPFGELLIADASADTIWQLSSDYGSLTTFFSGGSLGTLEAIAWHRKGLCIADGRGLYLLDPTGNLSSITSTMTVRTVAGRADGAVTFSAVGIRSAEPTTIFYHTADGYTSPFNGFYGIASDMVNTSAWFDEGDLLLSTSEGQILRQHRWGQSSLAYLDNANQVATAMTQGWGFQEFAATVRDGGSGDSSLILLRPDSQLPIHVGAPLDSPSDIVRDENGGYVVTDNGATKAVYRFAPDGTIATIYSGAPLADPTGVALDVDTGDYVVADAGSFALFRITRSGQLTTISGNVNARVVAHDSRSGHFFVGGFGSISRVTRAGVVSVVASGLDFVTDITMTANGTLLTVQVGIPTGGGIFEYDRNGGTVSQSLSDQFDSPWSMAIAYNDKVKGMGRAQIGSAYEMCIDTPGDAGVAYNLLASLSLRPGIPTQGRTIAIMPDALTAVAQVLPTIFRRFTGTLDDNGHAAPSIALPNDANLVGLRLFVGGFTSEAGYGTDGIRTIFNSIGITIR